MTSVSKWIPFQMTPAPARGTTGQQIANLIYARAARDRRAVDRRAGACAIRVNLKLSGLEVDIEETSRFETGSQTVDSEGATNRDLIGRVNTTAFIAGNHR
jgi:hypothetical protein